jgi:predicted methyltransferase
MNHSHAIILALVALLFWTPAGAADDVYREAVANPERPAADRERDASRRPAEVLEFAGIRPGMVVLDLFSGGGYYTEIIASIVGANGHVDAHSNAAYLNFVGDEFKDRHANERLKNVTVLMAENNELDLEAGRYDAVFLSLTYHDFFLPTAEGWTQIDIDGLLAKLHEGLKPGGVITIIDHYAARGSSTESATELHRIDPAIVIAGMEAAGFELDEQSDLLRNPDDDLSKSVFDPALRGQTDRFILRFRTPAN